MMTCHPTRIDRADAQPAMLLVNGALLDIEEARAHMPQALAELADVIGADVALELASRFGGRRVYIPMSATPDHPLAETLGLEAMSALVEYLGSGEFMVPSAKQLERFARDRAIRREHADGASCRTLAERYQLGERRVWEILAAHR